MSARTFTGARLPRTAPGPLDDLYVADPPRPPGDPQGWTVPPPQPSPPPPVDAAGRPV